MNALLYLQKVFSCRIEEFRFRTNLYAYLKWQDEFTEFINCKIKSRLRDSEFIPEFVTYKANYLFTDTKKSSNKNKKNFILLY